MLTFFLKKYKSIISSLILVSVLFCGGYFAPIQRFAHAEIELKQTIYVNNQHPEAADNNPGTSESAPLKTVNKAISLATPGTKIIIYPGTYRETVKIEDLSGTVDFPITIEARQAGQVIISGSDVFADLWSNEDQAGLYSYPWPYDWGLAPYPDPYWEQLGVVLEPIVRRKEMVFVDGKLLRQELSRIDLKQGSFYVAEDENKIYVRLEDSSNPAEHKIEVAVREHTLLVQKSQYIYIRGLVFQHSSHPVQGSSVEVTTSSYVTVENCYFNWNNWEGLSISSSDHVTVRNNVANNNGAMGMAAWRVEDSVFENNITNDNNWRGARGGFTGWAVAGFKALHIHRTLFKNHTAVANQARGFWADTNFAEVVIDGGIFEDNLKEGIFLEALQGPVSVKNARIDKLNGIESRNITLQDNIIGALYLSGASAMGEFPREPLEKWTLQNNILYTTNATPLIDVPGHDNFIETFTLSKNLYYSTQELNAFRFGGIPLNFKKWQDVTTQDLDSIWADPRFKNPASDDYSLLPDAPLHNKDTWPVRSLSPSHNRVDLIRKYKMEAIDKILSQVVEKRSYYEDPQENLRVAQGIGVLLDLPGGRGLREDFKQGTFAVSIRVPQGGATKQLLLAWRNEAGNNSGDTYIFLAGGRAAAGRGGSDPPQPFTELEIRVEDGSGNTSLTTPLGPHFQYEQWQDIVVNWGPDGVITYWNKERILNRTEYTGPLFDAGSPLILIWDVYKHKQGEIEIKDVVLLDQVLNPQAVQDYLANRTGNGRTFPGDANGDGRVDSEDFSLLVEDYLKEPLHNTDFNSDGRVDSEDFAILQANYLK